LSANWITIDNWGQLIDGRFMAAWNIVMPQYVGNTTQMYYVLIVMCCWPGWERTWEKKVLCRRPNSTRKPDCGLFIWRIVTSPSKPGFVFGLILLNYFSQDCPIMFFKTLCVYMWKALITMRYLNFWMRNFWSKMRETFQMYIAL
jgi:hypothetical protein